MTKFSILNIEFAELSTNQVFKMQKSGFVLQREEKEKKINGSFHNITTACGVYDTLAAVIDSS